MKRPSLQLVFRIPNDCQPVSEVQRDMAAFAALLVHPALKPARLARPCTLRMNSFPLIAGVSDIFVRDATGWNGPPQYVSGQRLERAKVLLRRGDQSLLDIAVALNFSSQANFTRAFRKGTGMTPGQYRRSFERH